MIVAASPTPNETARELIGRDYLSFSSINAYRSCPLQFKFRYVDGLPEETVSASLVFGSAIHSCLQFHYEELLAGNPAPDVDMLLYVYQDHWRRETVSRTVRFGRGEDVNTLGHLSERVLVAFQRNAMARPTGTILGIEEELRGELVPGCPYVLARIDLLIDEGEHLVLTDFKTSRSAWGEAKVRTRCSPPAGRPGAFVA